MWDYGEAGKGAGNEFAQSRLLIARKAFFPKVRKAQQIDHHSAAGSHRAKMILKTRS